MTSYFLMTLEIKAQLIARVLLDFFRYSIKKDRTANNTFLTYKLAYSNPISSSGAHHWVHSKSLLCPQSLCAIGNKRW